MVRTSNIRCHSYVNDKEEFEANHIFARNVGKYFYVVYSYGTHFPMYVYDKNIKVWYGNSDRYSNSTSKHQSQARPSSHTIIWMNTSELKNLINT